MMKLRKCEATHINGEDQIEGLFHRWYVDEDGDLCAMVEQKNGQVVRCQSDVKFLEPARQRVEVTPCDGPPKTGYLVEWYQYNNGYVAGPIALIQFDDGKSGSYAENQIRIIQEEVKNEN